MTASRGHLPSCMVRLVVCCGCMWRGNMVPAPLYSTGTSDANHRPFGHGIDVNAARVDMG